MKFTIFLPAKNENETINQIIKGCQKTLKSSEIIVVDDGSEKPIQGKNCIVLRHNNSLGLTTCFNSALKIATGDIFIFLPTDGQSNPEEDLPKLVEKINKGFDVVTGNRRSHSGSKFLDSELYNFILRMIFNLHTHDNNWIKAFKKDLLSGTELKSDWHRLLIPILSSKTNKIAEVDVNYYPRKFGRSNYGLERVPRTLWDIFTVKLKF